MYCPKCGRLSPDEAKECTECGLRFGAITSEAVFDPYTNSYRQPQSVSASVPGKGLGITSMILGIISIVISLAVYVAIPFAVLGVALGGYGKSKSNKLGLPNGCATAGIACSCVCFGILLLIAIIAYATDSLFFTTWYY